MKELYVKTRAQWRNWLSRNHASSKGAWLVFYKKAAGVPTLEYGAAVEEALCFGWVDSIVRKLDEHRYARKMTPRKNASNWSAINIKRVDKLIKQGLMTKAGLEKIAAARKSGLYSPAVAPAVSYAMPPELQQALRKNKKAAAFFTQLAPSYRKQFIGWINVARRPETRIKRVVESIGLLEQEKKLGLK